MEAEVTLERVSGPDHGAASAGGVPPSYEAPEGGRQGGGQGQGGAEGGGRGTYARLLVGSVHDDRLLASRSLAVETFASPLTVGGAGGWG